MHSLILLVLCQCRGRAWLQPAFQPFYASVYVCVWHRLWGKASWWWRQEKGERKLLLPFLASNICVCVLLPTPNLPVLVSATLLPLVLMRHVVVVFVLSLHIIRNCVRRLMGRECMQRSVLFFLFLWCLSVLALSPMYVTRKLWLQLDSAGLTHTDAGCLSLPACYDCAVYECSACMIFPRLLPSPASQPVLAVLDACALVHKLSGLRCRCCRRISSSFVFSRLHHTASVPSAAAAAVPTRPAPGKHYSCSAHRSLRLVLLPLTDSRVSNSTPPPPTTTTICPTHLTRNISASSDIVVVFIGIQTLCLIQPDRLYERQSFFSLLPIITGLTDQEQESSSCNPEIIRVSLTRGIRFPLCCCCEATSSPVSSHPGSAVSPLGLMRAPTSAPPYTHTLTPLAHNSLAFVPGKQSKEKPVQTSNQNPVYELRLSGWCFSMPLLSLMLLALNAESSPWLVSPACYCCGDELVWFDGIKWESGFVPLIPLSICYFFFTWTAAHANQNGTNGTGITRMTIFFFHVFHRPTRTVTCVYDCEKQVMNASSLEEGAVLLNPYSNFPE